MQGNHPENVMEETGKQNKVFVSSDDIFQNTECLFIEYDDVLKSPMFSLLNIIKDRESVKKIFDMTEFDGLTSNELYEWYVERESKNMFKYFDLLDDSLTNIFDDDVNVFYRWCDSFYEDMYKSLPTETLQNMNWLNFDTPLRNLLKTKTDKTGLVKKIYVWHPFYSENIEKDLKSRYHESVTFVYGDLINVLIENEIKPDSTFVFSELLNVLNLAKAGILNYSSVLIADEYYYNYDSEMEPIINFEEIFKDYIFKIDFFDNIYNLDSETV